MQKTSFLLILGASLSVLVCAQPARAASLMGTLAAPQRAGAAEPAEGSSAEAEPMSKESEELCAAAASGRTEDAKRLLENGADVNAACWYECDAGGQRDMQWGRAAALLCAARFGQAEAVHLLIEAGADPDKIGNVTTGEKMWVTAVSHCTALPVAAKYGHADVVRGLLEAGADADASCQYGHKIKHALEWAHGHADIEKMIQEAPAASLRKTARQKRWDNEAAALTKEADQTLSAGQPDKALAFYMSLLHDNRWNPFVSGFLHGRILKAVSLMKEPPAIPEEATRRMTRGTILVKQAKEKADYVAAASEMERAIEAAPWWASAYYNVALVQAEAGRYNQAMVNMQLYLAAAPGAPDARAAQNKIYEWEIESERPQKTEAAKTDMTDSAEEAPPREKKAARRGMF